jgi:hypothetical protein
MMKFPASLDATHANLVFSLPRKRKNFFFSFFTWSPKNFLEGTASAQFSGEVENETRVFTLSESRLF